MSTKKIQYSSHPFLIAKGIKIPKINRRRRVWAFLPSDYLNNPQKRYPVIYLNDGQNVFEGWKAALGKGWETHNRMRQIAQIFHHESILIGIEHGKKHRKGEYMPFDFSGGFSFEGNAYADFVANELKTFVDKKLRTLPEREHTSIIGSSLGGLNAIYTGFKHQDVFSKVGVLSPSLWAAPTLLPLIRQVGKHFYTQFYLSVGDKEGAKTVFNTQQLYHTLADVGFEPRELRLNIVPNGRHNEALWEEEFSNFYQWAYSLN